ncbi:MAG: tetratricopeptide repeat protein, partial [Pseudomonadota bacterium]
GGKVQSNLTFAAYLEDLNRTISRTDRTFINTSPNGARIRGTLEMSLDEAIKSYCLKEHNFRPVVSRLLNEPVRDFTAALSEISKLDTEIEALEVVISKSLELNGRITSLAAGPGRPNIAELQTLLNTHAKYAGATLKYCEVFPPLRKYLTPCLALLSEGGRIINQDRNWREALVSAMEQNRLMAVAARQAGARLRQLLTEIRGTLVEIMETNQALNSGHGSLEIHRRAALAWAGLGRLKPAWRHFRDALALAPGNAGLIIEAARLCLSRKRLTTARDLLKQIPSNHPQRYQAQAVLDRIEETELSWLNRAENLLSVDDWIGALLLSRKVLASGKENLKAKEIEKKCLDQRAERITAARRMAEDFNQKRRKQVIIQRAEEAFNAGRHQEVIELLEGQLDPDSWEDHKSLVLLGASLADRGRGPEALRILKDIHRRRPDWAYVAAILGPVLIKNGHLRPGVVMLEKAGSLDRDYSQFLFEAGCLRQKAGEFDLAIKDFETYLTANPGSYETINKLAVCHLALGRPVTARHYFQKVLALKPDSETARAGLLKSLEAEESRLMRQVR